MSLESKWTVGKTDGGLRTRVILCQDNEDEEIYAKIQLWFSEADEPDEEVFLSVDDLEKFDKVISKAILLVRAFEHEFDEMDDLEDTTVTGPPGPYMDIPAFDLPGMARTMPVEDRAGYYGEYVLKNTADEIPHERSGYLRTDEETSE